MSILSTVKTKVTPLAALTLLWHEAGAAQLHWFRISMDKWCR